MHRGGKAVVRGLAAVDVVVGVHRRAAAERPAEAQVGEVRQHLVRVHVGLRARAGLPDRQRELRVAPARHHLLRGGHDRLGDLGREFAQREVRARGGPLLQADGADQDGGEALRADGEEPARAFRLRSPQGACGDLDAAEAVGFGSCFNHVRAS